MLPDSMLRCLGLFENCFTAPSYQRFLTEMVHAFGARGVAATSPYDAWQDRLMRGRAATIYGGTSEVQRNIIAKSMGLPTSAAR